MREEYDKQKCEFQMILKHAVINLEIKQCLNRLSKKLDISIWYLVQDSRGQDHIYPLIPLSPLMHTPVKPRAGMSRERPREQQ